MSETTKTKVIHLLEEYTESKQRIALLRYELEHPTTITPAEMIDAMTFTKSSGECRSIGTVSDKTHNIATNYETAADRLNSELMNELTARLLVLEQKVNKLEFYLTLLSEQEQKVIQALYFQKKSLQTAADDFQVSVWMIRKDRDGAVKRLCEMYDFVERG